MCVSTATRGVPLSQCASLVIPFCHRRPLEAELFLEAKAGVRFSLLPPPLISTPRKTSTSCAMGFGIDLWDQWKEVEEYAGQNAVFMDRIYEFMKKRAELEMDYAKGLQKLAKSYRDDPSKKMTGIQKMVQASSVMQSWNLLLNEVESLGNCHQSVADQIETDIRRPMKQQSKDIERFTKESFDEIRKMYSELKKQVELMEKQREKYEKSVKDMDSVRASYEKAQKDVLTTKNQDKLVKEVERLRVEAERKAVSARDALEAYKKCIAETNQKKNSHFTVDVPKTLDAMQQYDEQQRIAFTRTMFQKLSGLVRGSLPSIQGGLDLMEKTFATIDPKYDSDLVIKMLKTTQTPPDDFVFEGKVDVGTCLQPKNDDALKSPTKSGDKLEETEDEIVALPTKKGKKKAIDRLKSLEKEIADYDRKRTGVESLMGACRVLVDDHQVQSQKDLEAQLNLVESKLDSLLARKHKIEVYLCTVEGIPIPQPPQPVHGRSLTGSPVTMNRAMSIGTESMSRGSVGFDSTTASIPVSPSTAIPEEGAESTIPPAAHATLAGSDRVLSKTKVIFDFDGAPDSAELSVKVDEILDVLEKLDDGWWRCRKSDNGELKEGFVPGNYTEEIQN
ncbi:uncharacterized protein BJ171DRAFT_518017 [Polychytrium aggregatum]|uniref:uncharacterized protein n=1 Tax=Polychytrium aggregatum TaxID=110093 RepID=UPI0022FF407D|nr:uncharacterized protein BJ171DRAFT_518017 [Polychytrium aggregatum]KAI9199592.1 hypothetical protein BJ171DRAFT_518017 [Polychytrium aggregatum]